MSPGKDWLQCIIPMSYIQRGVFACVKAESTIPPKRYRVPCKMQKYLLAYSTKILLKTTLKWKGCHHQNIINSNTCDNLLAIQEAITKSHQLLILSLPSPSRKPRWTFCCSNGDSVPELLPSSVWDSLRDADLELSGAQVIWDYACL